MAFLNPGIQPIHNELFVPRTYKFWSKMTLFYQILKLYLLPVSKTWTMLHGVLFCILDGFFHQFSLKMAMFIKKTSKIQNILEVFFKIAVFRIGLWIPIFSIGPWIPILLNGPWIPKF